MAIEFLSLSHAFGAPSQFWAACAGQTRESLASLTLNSKEFIEFWKQLLFYQYISHAIFNHYDIMNMSWKYQVLARVKVYYATIMQISLCARIGQLFHGIPLSITALKLHISQCSSLYSLLFKSLWVLNSPQFYMMLPQEEISITRTARKKKKTGSTSVLYVSRSLNWHAAQEKLVLLHHSFWCSSHHLHHEEEWWSSVLLYDTDSNCSLKREQEAGQVTGCQWIWCWSNRMFER